MRVNKSLFYKKDLGECFSLVLPWKTNPSAEVVQHVVQLSDLRDLLIW